MSIGDVTISGPAYPGTHEGQEIFLDFVAEYDGEIIAAFKTEEDANLFRWARHLETLIPPQFRPPASAADVMLGSDEAIIRDAT